MYAVYGFVLLSLVKMACSKAIESLDFFTTTLITHSTCHPTDVFELYTSRNTVMLENAFCFILSVNLYASMGKGAGGRGGESGLISTHTNVPALVAAMGWLPDAPKSPVSNWRSPC